MNEQSLWLASEWASRLGPTVSNMTAEPARAGLEGPGPPPQPEPDAIIWRQLLDLTPEAALWVVAPATLWRELGLMVLKAAGLDEPDASEVRGTFLEILQQSLSAVCSLIGARLGKEVTLAEGIAADSLPEDMDWAGVRVSASQRQLGTLYFSCAPELAGALEPAEVHAPGLPPPAPGLVTGSRTFDLLMEVELPVGVSFGRTQMRLKDAIKLTTGSIVELNRSVVEPVEVIVNNCVIARGEVVVVEGNYGVRIRQIISREERLRTLF
ncbi:MAG: flagellar motor switch protein FliN [Candidatus Solibacter usitatus]|nr:flagellar motor switch protein FliN [Candidatus Solibacter usitatus]